MEKAIAVSTKVSAGVAVDDGKCLTVIMVITYGLKLGVEKKIMTLKITDLFCRSKWRN